MYGMHQSRASRMVLAEIQDYADGGGICDYINFKARWQRRRTKYYYFARCVTYLATEVRMLRNLHTE